MKLEDTIWNEYDVLYFPLFKDGYRFFRDWEEFLINMSTVYEPSEEIDVTVRPSIVFGTVKSEVQTEAQMDVSYIPILSDMIIIPWDDLDNLEE